MENPFLPWQTPGLKMERKRSPAATAKQQHTPPVTKLSPESFIWRTRSLDDGRSRSSAGGRSSSKGEDRHEKPSHDMDGALLHSSFDAALLENDAGTFSIFRSKRRASESGASWDIPATKNDPTPHKLARTALDSNESIKSKGTPVRPPTGPHQWRTNTRAPASNSTGMYTGWKLPPPKFPCTPAAPDTATQATHPTTTQILESTVEMEHRVAANQSPTAFRFCSFPASLPRVHPREHGSLPNSVRKRVFAAPTMNVNQSREENSQNDTSISSLSSHGEDPTGGRMPPVHTRLFEEYAYSEDEEEEEDDDDCTGLVGRTRLNFNLMLSPKMPMQKEESPFKDLGEAAQKDALKMPLEESEEATAPTDLSRPYEQRHVHSFPSTMSSHTPLRSLSGCDDFATASTCGLTTGGGEPTLDAPAAIHQQHQFTVPETPEEVQLHFQFDAGQCSPIPGIPEEEDLRPRPGLRAGRACSRLPPKPRSTSAATTLPEAPLANCKSSHSVGKEGQQDDARLSFSQESVSSSASAKLRRFRPMPDMSAFEMDSGSKNGQDRSCDNMSGMRSPPPKLLCPPTPVRTPVWAHDDESGSGEKPLLHHRSNSLIVTRILATCSPQIMDSMASSAPNNKSTEDATMEMDLDTRPAHKQHEGNPNDPQHPQAPPPIRRSVGEMGSIISFATDFETLGILGKGTFGDVFKVRCKLDNNLYAVKRNRRHFRSKKDRSMALAEVRSMQRLQQQSSDMNNNFLQYLLFFYRAWQEDGHFFCQTELCCRDTCRELMDSVSHEWCVAQKRYPSLVRNTPAPEGVPAGCPLDVNGRLVPNNTVWKICHDISAGLSHIHSRGLCHNDIKPSNIFFVLHDEHGCLCKIGDFGMTSIIGTSEDGQEGDSMYMAPELLSSGEKHASLDIFSLGLTIYELAAGHGFDLPKQGPRWHQLRNGRHVPELPTSREPSLSQLIQKMISASPDKRPSAAAILKSEKVQEAGGGLDQFLRDYIRDIQDHDKREEERQAAAEQMANEQTPRTGAIPCRARVCSPTLGHLATTGSTTMFTPKAQ